MISGVRRAVWRAIAVIAAAAIMPAGGVAAKAGPATGVQQPRLDPAFAEVDTWVARGAFPGAVLAVGQHKRVLALKAFGRIEAAPGAPPMRADTIFDLASLTKVVGTTTAAALLYDRHQLDLDAPVAQYLPAFGAAPGHAAITVRHLLTHSSGLTPTGLLWRQATDRAGILRLIDAMPVTEPPGSAYHYRDENMILLAEIVARVTGEPLDRFLAREVFAPLGMRATQFNPPAALRRRIAPTEQDDVFRHTLVRGVVHDENAYVMGGVAGHAGLFSTAGDLAKLAQLYLDRGRYHGRQLLRPETIALFTTPQGLPPGSSRALGWDTPPAGGGFAGPRASSHAILHTGFTGTSMYIDFDRDAFVVLLTNRVNPTRDNPLISQARPAIHGAVLAALDGGAGMPEGAKP